MPHVHITNPIESDHCVNVVYIGFAKPKGISPAIDDRQMINGSATLRPGDSMPVEIFKGHGSISLHQGQTIVRVPPSDNKQS